MTYAPADLLAVRLYLLASTGLSGDAVGIVGDDDHLSTGGYHIGNDGLSQAGRLTSDYSKRESSRDRPGSNAASALDIGQFVRGGVSLRSLTLGIVAACQRGDPRTGDVREIIYTPDGSTVRRFDRLGIRSTGDSSHLFHTHVSFFRDSEGRRAQTDNFLGLLRELIEGGDGDMTPEQAEALARVDGRLAVLYYGMPTNPYGAGPMRGEPNQLQAALVRLEQQAAADAARDAAAKAAIDALTDALRAGGGSVETSAIIARIDAAAARESAAVAGLQERIAELVRQLADRDERLAAALAPPAGG